MKYTLRNSLAVTLGLALLTVGCASLHDPRYSLNLMDGAPKVLSVDTAGTGLLLITTDYLVDGVSGAMLATLVDTTNPKHKVQGGFIGDSWIIVDNIPPGIYRLAEVGARGFRAGEGTAYSYMGMPEDDPVFTVKIEAGKAAYLGRVKVRVVGNIIGHKTTIEMVNDPETERAGWKKLLERNGESPWAPEFRRRLGAVKAGSKGPKGP